MQTKKIKALKKPNTTINLLGEKFTIKFNMAVEIAYERITEKPFDIQDTLRNAESRIALCMAAILTANPETKITIEDILYKATAQDVAKLTQAVFDAFAVWCNLPMEKATDKTDEDKEKN